MFRRCLLETLGGSLTAVLRLAVAAGLMLTLLSVADSALAATYRTRCRIEDGRAVGYIRLEKPTSLSFSGKAWFTQFDADGDQIDRTWTTVVAVVVGTDLERVDDVDAEAGAATCSFDVSEIIGPSDDDPADPDAGYETFCEIRDGRAWGSMRLTGAQSSLSFSGKVWFEFFDDDGDSLGRDWTTAVVIIVGHDREPVEDVKAPTRARDCTLDVSEAIDR